MMMKEQIFNCNNYKYHKDEKRDDLEHCCIDCRYLKFPFEVDETEVPKPTNPYCTKGKDKDFPKIQSKVFEWINYPDYDSHICDEFKLSWWIRLGLRGTYKEYQERVSDE